MLLEMKTMSNFIESSPNKGKYIANTFYLFNWFDIGKKMQVGLRLSQVMLPPMKR